MQEFTVNIAADMAEKLDKLAAKMGRSPSFLASKALEEFVCREIWQVAEIEAGIGDARLDIAVRREVVDDVGVCLFECLEEERCILGVALDEASAEDSGRILDAVEDGDFVALGLEPAGEVTTDESGPTDQQRSQATSLTAAIFAHGLR